MIAASKTSSGMTLDVASAAVRRGGAATKKNQAPGRLIITDGGRAGHGPLAWRRGLLALLAFFAFGLFVGVTAADLGLGDAEDRLVMVLAVGQLDQSHAGRKLEVGEV